MDARDKLAELIHSWIIEEANLHGLSLEDLADAILALKWEEAGKQYRVAVVEETSRIQVYSPEVEAELDSNYE